MENESVCVEVSLIIGARDGTYMILKIEIEHL